MSPSYQNPTGTMSPRSTGYKASNNIPPGYELGQYQQFDPQQMNLYEGLFSQLGPNSFLQQLAQGNPEMFAQLEAPALKQFGELQGQIASRFSGAGMGARQGSGFNIAQGQAASDFAQQLQSQRQQLRRQAMMDLFGLSSELLGQRPYEKFLTKKPTSFWERLFSGLGGAAVGGATGYATGGPVGAGLGAVGGFGSGIQGVS